jgi:hypothetical protein
MRLAEPFRQPQKPGPHVTLTQAEPGNCRQTGAAVYDRECPVCRNCCQPVRIRKAAGEMQIVNARKRCSTSRP